MARILIIEDEAVVAADLAGIVTDLGHEVVGEVALGLRAIAGVRECDPDLVLVDVRIQGGIDGVEVVRAMRAVRDVPAVFVTASTDPETLRRISQVGAAGLVRKPFTPRAIASAVEAALRERPLRATG